MRRNPRRARRLQGRNRREPPTIAPNSPQPGRALLIVNRRARSGAEQAEAAVKAMAEAGLDVHAFDPPEGMSCAEAITGGLAAAPQVAASTGW